MKPILTVDFETDPFKHGRVVRPFACGLYNGKDFDSFWSADCADKLLKRLSTLPASIIYMHNGGRFDIYYLMHALTADMRIINGRIVSAHIGQHEVRDSYAALPFPLKAYRKEDIDITKLEAHVRHSHRVEILSYLRTDCVSLHELMVAFLDEFGDYLTVGSAAMHQLEKFHTFKHTGAYHDEKFRKQFFFGGRVQCFAKGIVRQDYKIFDVNSMYPFVMRDFKHPSGATYSLDRSITQKTGFVCAEGINYGAFPTRTPQGISFTGERGTYCTTIHEWNAAEETGYFKPIKILKTYNFDEWMSFGEFVDHFYAARYKAKKDKDKLHELFYKYILNSAYGKFAQNPDNFGDFCITRDQQLEAPWHELKIYQKKGKQNVNRITESNYVIWKKPIEKRSYYNVAVGASITGAARSVLMHAIRNAHDPLYVDTDSIICRELRNTSFGDTELGRWKLEGTGDSIAIAGKKLYACFNGKECIKTATKGARLTPDEISRVAKGETVVYRNKAPTFKLDGSVTFIERKIKRTI